MSKTMQRPPRIVGEVAPDYTGPVFYRLRGLTYEIPRFMQASPLIFEAKGIGQTIASADQIQIAHRMGPHLFDDQGELRPEFRQSLKARFRSGVPRRIPEFLTGGLFFYVLVSARVRDVVERHEPAKNLFLPVDVERGGETSRHYLFYAQRHHAAAALAFRANGVEPKFSHDGNPFWGAGTLRDDMLSPPRFLYLNSAAIGRRKLYLAPPVGLVFAKEVVDELGDVLPENLAFTPMGVVHEPYESPAFRQAAALAADSAGDN